MVDLTLTDAARDELFAKLDALGFEGVQLARNNGVSLGDDHLVVLWLQSKAFDRQEEAQTLQRRAVEAAERPAEASLNAAKGSHRAATWTMAAALASLAGLIILVLDRWFAR